MLLLLAGMNMSENEEWRTARGVLRPFSWSSGLGIRYGRIVPRHGIARALDALVWCWCHSVICKVSTTTRTWPVKARDSGVLRLFACGLLGAVVLVGGRMSMVRRSKLDNSKNLISLDPSAQAHRPQCRCQRPTGSVCCATHSTQVGLQLVLCLQCHRRRSS